MLTAYEERERFWANEVKGCIVWQEREGMVEMTEIV